MNLIELKSSLRAQYIKRRSLDMHDNSREKIASELMRTLKKSGLRLGPEHLSTITQDLLDDIFGFGPLQRLLDDHNVSEIMVNGPFSIFVEIEGLQVEARSAFDNEQHLIEILNRLVRRANQRLDEASPTVNCVIDGI